MIGYSGMSRKYFHREGRRYLKWVFAACPGEPSLNCLFPDDDEERLKKFAPHLTRCPRCWPKAKASTA